jgi:signal transduction histidine kinase
LNVSREIHDELGQQLAVLKMNISRLDRKETSDGETISPEIADLLASVGTMLETARKISFRLRPGLLDDIGLVAALDWYCTDFSKRTGIKTCFTSSVLDDKFPQHLKIGFFRVLQESLSNVVMHAEAKETHVSIKRQDRQLFLIVSDNGKGFDSSGMDENKIFGIMGMKERAIMMGGTYNVSSTPGKGTVIEVIVPYNHTEPAETAGSL